MILHQGDERRNDDGSAASHHGRGLIAKGFAAPGGHECEHVAAGERIADHGLLARPEGLEAEDALQRGMQIRRHPLNRPALMLTAKPRIEALKRNEIRVWASTDLRTDTCVVETSDVWQAAAMVKEK